MAKTKVKGFITYSKNKTISTDVVNYAEPKKIQSYERITLKEFFEKTKEYEYSDLNGYIANIIVDGYDTNLGINYESVHSGGDFKCTRQSLTKLLKDKRAVVNWVNQG